MSLAKDKFFELLVPHIEALGYTFKKSKGSFEKVRGDLNYDILFSWDGRGGTTYLNNVMGKVHIPAIAKAIKKLIAIQYEAYVWQGKKMSKSEFKIPQMYTRQLIELANMMRFKEMAAMPFEEKYPIENIKKTVEVVHQQIIQEIIPFHNTVHSEIDILNWYIQKALVQIDSKDYHNIFSFAFPIKMMCKKLRIDEPPFIKAIDFFTNDSMDILWNNQSIDFNSLKARYDAIVF